MERAQTLSRIAPVILALLLGEPASAQCLQWNSGFAAPNAGQGMNARVYDLAVFQQPLPTQAPFLGVYAGGDFTQAGTTSANRIACWDGTQWQACGSGCSGSVFSLTSDMTNTGSPMFGVFAGGLFATAGGQSANNIAKWYGGWQTLTDTNNVSGTNGAVYAMKVKAGADLYLGGTFSSAGSTSASNIARWNGFNFFPLGNGTSGRIDAIEVFDDGGGPAIYAGGWFSNASNATGTNLIAKWTGTNWVSVGGGLVGSNVYDLCSFDFDGPGGNPPELVAAGNFSMAGSTSVSNIARWNGTSWSGVGLGFNNVVRDVQPFDDGSGSKLFATGHFTADGNNGVQLDLIARYDNNAGSWGPLWGPDLGGGNVSLCLASYDDLSAAGDDLYVGSICTTAGGAASNFIGEWQGCTRAPLPMIDGEIAVTRAPRSPGDFSVVLVDMRPPAAPVGTPWKAPKNSNETNGNSAAIWNEQNLGHVFGVCFDGATPPNIFVSATSSYPYSVAGSGGFGAVYKLASIGGGISTFAQLPNTGSGLGDICFDRWHNISGGGQFFVSNFEDGKIYRYTAAGVLQQVYDPFPSTNNNSGMVQLGERVWAVQVFNSRELYFSVWLRDSGRQSTAWPSSWGTQGPLVNNAIFRVSMNGTSGAILPGSEVLVKVLPYIDINTSWLNYSNPVTDIAFSRDNQRMLLAEKGMYDDYTTTYSGPGRVLEYVGGGPGNLYLNWTSSSTSYQVGEVTYASTGECMSCEGGATYDCVDRVLSTGEPLGTMTPNMIAGVQRIPAAGNNGSINVTTSHLIDIDGETFGADKLSIGDVEMWRPTCRKKWYTYCTAKQNSLGCTPTIDASGDPLPGPGATFIVSATNVRNQKPGLLLYSVTGVQASPFQGGYLCVAAPIRRTVGLNSGGTPTPAADCSGVLMIDMTAFGQGSLGGNPAVELTQVGATIDCQFWSRDPGFAPPNNSSLSDSLEYVIEP